MDFITPVGRLVQGSCFEGSSTDNDGNPRVIKSGTNKGKPTTVFFQAIAFSKTDQAFITLYNQIVAVGRAGYPHLFDAQGNCTMRDFAFKVIDGDGFDKKGKPNKDKEGFAGHWILRLSSSYAPKCYEVGKYDPAQRLTDPSRIKRGYFIRASGTIIPNTGSETPGVYVNSNLIELVYHGPEIVSGPDAGAVFGAAPVAGGALPAGAIPLGMAPGAVPGQPGGTLPGMMPGQVAAQPMGQVPGQVAAQLMGAFPGQVAAPAAAQPVPNHGFVQAAMGQVPGQVAAQPMGAFPGQVAAPAAVAKQRMMTAAANGYTYEQFIANGFTDQMMLEQGFMQWVG